jgi:hypothetical protein
MHGFTFWLLKRYNIVFSGSEVVEFFCQTPDSGLLDFVSALLFFKKGFQSM